MTIAAGFLCGEGVLLCADSEFAGWTLESPESKLGNFEVPGGKIAYALSGNSLFAWATMKKCQNRLQSVAPGNILTELDKLLAEEYRLNVLTHPSEASDRSSGYQLLIAFWQASQGAALYVAGGTTIRKVQSFECVGAGSALSSFLSRLSFQREMPDRTAALFLAAHALSGVKESISGCGEASLYLFMQNDGNVGRVGSLGQGNFHAEDFVQNYDILARRLWLALADERLEDCAFEKLFSEKFKEPLLEARREWTADRLRREAEFLVANPRINARGARLFLRLSRALLPN